MKNFLAVAALAMLVSAGVAYAAGYNSLTYYQVDTSPTPTPLTPGLPLHQLKDGEYRPLKQITITVSDFSDGGNILADTSDDDFLRGFTLSAWRKVGAGQLPVSRDAGYARQPELDARYIATAAAIASSTNPKANTQASRSWSVTLGGGILTQYCEGLGTGGDAGVNGQYCYSSGATTLPIYPVGSQLFYTAPPNGVMTLDGGVKPFLVTLDGVY